MRFGGQRACNPASTLLSAGDADRLKPIVRRSKLFHRILAARQNRDLLLQSIAGVGSDAPRRKALTDCFATKPSNPALRPSPAPAS